MMSSVLHKIAVREEVVPVPFRHIGARVCRWRAAHLRPLRGCARAFCVVLLADWLMAN
jgi:hypothetical protein